MQIGHFLWFFFSNNELPYENIAPPGCNGYQIGGMAGGMGFMGNGMGGFGNPYMSAGYSPGFMGGMSGPYGMYNPYGSMNGMRDSHLSSISRTQVRSPDFG